MFWIDLSSVQTAQKIFILPDCFTAKQTKPDLLVDAKKNLPRM